MTCCLPAKSASDSIDMRFTATESLSRKAALSPSRPHGAPLFIYFFAFLRSAQYFFIRALTALF